MQFLSPMLFFLYSEYFTDETLEGYLDIERGGQVICTVKYADDLMLLAKKERMLNRAQLTD